MTIQWRRSLAVIGFAAILALAGCQSTSDPSDSGPGSTAASPTQRPASSAEASASAATGDGEETSVFDLAVGDCFTEVGEATESVVVIDCADAHRYEVFALVDHPGGSDDEYPGDDEIGEFGDQACRAPFSEYVGHDYETSAYWITTLTPSSETWPQGDREIVCTLRLGEQGDETTGSAEGSGQ